MMTTYKDLIDELVDYLGGNNTVEGERFARRAVQRAYTEVATGHTWQYYWTRGRLVTVPQMTFGTIQYTDATGIVTLTPDGTVGHPQTWPTGVTFYNIVLNDFIMKIASQIDSLNIVLDPTTRLGSDLPAGSKFTLYRDTYPLPSDFRASDELINLNNTGPLNYLHPREWLTSQRLRRGPATPRIYTFTGDPKYFGAMEVKLFPAPDLNYEFDYLYQRLPRPLAISEYKTGSATLVANNTNVNGSGVVWTSAMVGSIIRFSQDSKNAPSGPTGPNPALFESLITAVPTSTSITLTSTPGINLSGVSYSISDPVDIEDAAQRVFLAREMEKQMRYVRRMRSSPDEIAEYREAQTKAWEHDARNLGRRASGMSLGFPQRLANMPRGADVS